MAKYPWGEIQAKFESGKYTMPELADEYGFSLSYGYNKKSAEGWVKGKHEDEVNQKAAKKALEEVVEDQAELKKEYALYSTLLRRLTYQGIKEGLVDRNSAEEGSGGITFDNLKKIKIASEIFQNTRKMDWSIFDISEPATEINQNVSGEVVNHEKYTIIVKQIAEDGKSRKALETIARRNPGLFSSSE